MDLKSRWVRETDPSGDKELAPSWGWTSPGPTTGADSSDASRRPHAEFPVSLCGVFTGVGRSLLHTPADVYAEREINRMKVVHIPSPLPSLFRGRQSLMYSAPLLIYSSLPKYFITLKKCVLLTVDCSPSLAPPPLASFLWISSSLNKNT